MLSSRDKTVRQIEVLRFDQKHNPGVQMHNEGLKNKFLKKVPYFLI